MPHEPENQRIARLMPLTELLARIETLVVPLAPREIGLADALFRVLAADVTAAASLPAQAIALIDGYAVRAEAIADACSYSQTPLANAPVRVAIGQPLPTEADAVVAPDAISQQDGLFYATASTIPGHGVLPAAADLTAGDFVACAGWRLNDFNLAMLAMSGRGHIAVREPRVCLAYRPDDAVIRAIADLLARALAARGCVVVRDQCGLEPTDRASDAIIGIGGTGSGSADTSVRALARLGRVEVHGVAISPGETTAFGMMHGRPVLLLPGRIDAAVAAFLTIGLPLIDRLAGSSDAADPGVTAALTRKIASPLGLVELVPVRLAAGKAEPTAAGYWPLKALASSDGWIRVPADSEGFPAGAEVMVRPWP
jgi:molybdopterin biosynthesis enzyme